MTHENSNASYSEHKRSGKREHFRIAIFEIIKTATEAVTDRQVMQILKQSDPNNVRPEITRLKDDLLVKETGKAKCQVTGKTVRLVCWTGREYCRKGQAPALQSNQTEMFGHDKIDKAMG